MIEIKNLHKAFGKNRVLKGVNMNFDQPGITAVLGPNGSGKTTLIKCILGMVLPDEGEILVHGKSIANQWQYRNQIDYLPQIARFPENLKVKEMLQMIKDLRPQKAHEDELIELFDLEPFMDQKMGNLSGGTLQKINLVQAFMYDSPMLILDEPTVGLDPLAMIHLRELLEREKQKGKFIQITTHIMSFVEEVADELIFLLEGQLYFRGTVSALKEKYAENNLEKAIANILQGAEAVPSDRIGFPISKA